MSESAAKTASGKAAAPDLTDKIRGGGRQLAGEARLSASRIAGSQRDALSDYLSALATAAVAGGEELDSAGYPRSAATVTHTAGEVDGFARRLRERAPSDFWDDAEDFAREHPALTFTAGFALAFGVTRFLKSSAPAPLNQRSEAQDPTAAEDRQGET